MVARKTCASKKARLGIGDVIEGLKLILHQPSRRSQNADRTPAVPAGCDQVGYRSKAVIPTPCCEEKPHFSIPNKSHEKSKSS